MNILASRGAVCVLVAVVIGVVLAGSARAQYQQSVFDLKKSSELWDERGYSQGKALSIDGKLAVSGSNGNVSYIYPISKTTVSGYPLEVTLNYCGSVAFTAFKRFVNPEHLATYRYWEKFQQNRPAWLLGVNGFCVQMLSTVLENRSPHRILASGPISFNDSSLAWLADGYDFCNRMAPVLSIDGSRYTDVIHILRADGSVMELVNVHDPVVDQLPEYMPELYTGHYFLNEANAKGYGVVEYDSTYWPDYIKRHTDSLGGGNCQFVPRKLKYYPGDGLEYVFREWIIPYGLSPYLGKADFVTNEGGRYTAGPTIFYLEAINSAGGTITTFERSRQKYPEKDAQGNDVLDSTAGRALCTGFLGHTITYNDQDLTIEAFGRSTRVQFTKQVASGDALRTPWAGNSYLATYGMLTGSSLQHATYDIENMLCGSVLNYVTAIFDPENRKTSFGYENYTRRFVNFDFPFPHVGSDSVVLELDNYRLSTVGEMTTTYNLSYTSGYSPAGQEEDTVRFATLYPNLGYIEDHPYLMSNVASYVRKYDKVGTLLTTQHGHYTYDRFVKFGFTVGRQETTDNLTGHTRAVTNVYDVFQLTDYFSWLPRPRYTALVSTTEEGGLTTKDTTVYARSAESDNVILPTTETVTVNGITKQSNSFAFTLDTLRHYGGNSEYTTKFGWEPVRKVARSLNPSGGGVLLVDTTLYSYLPAIDTMLMAHDTVLNVTKMFGRYNAYHDAGIIKNSFQDAWFDPRVYWADITSGSVRRTLPPIFGLVSQEWASNASGSFLKGIKNTYMTPATTGSFDDMAFRGMLQADSMIGRNRASTILGTARYHIRGYGRSLIGGIATANGSVTLSDFTATTIGGKVSYDNNAVRDTSLPDPRFFSLAFEQPSVMKQVIRRYNPATFAIVHDTLMTATKYSYYGQPIGSADNNGQFSGLRYDGDGRLLRAWLPLDFPRRDSLDTVSYTGTEAVDLYGMTRNETTFDTMTCKDGYGGVAHGATANVTTTAGATMEAGHPMLPKPDCSLPGYHDTAMIYPGTIYDVGIIKYAVDASSLLTSVISLTGATLTLHATSVNMPCATLEVRITQFSFSKSYTFNCPFGTPLVLGADSTYSVAVDLSSIASSIAGLHAGDNLTIELHVSTPGASMTFVSGSNGNDLKPRLTLAGTFHRLSDDADFTLGFEHDDSYTSPKARVSAKVDDIHHTANQYDLGALHGAAVRMTDVVHEFGADNRVNRTRRIVGDPAYPAGEDTTAHAYTGLGVRRSTEDAMHDVVETRYDTAGRPVEVINADGTSSTIAYEISAGPADYYGFMLKKVGTNETGRLVEEYYDAFDRLRRKVIDPSGLRIETVHTYDTLGHALTVINPKGQMIGYAYDDFGRLMLKSMPDLGTTTFAYDKMGNQRFSQTQEQARKNLLGFIEYDDLNRPTLIGEAQIGREDACQAYCEDSIAWTCGSAPDGSNMATRLTALYDPTILHAAGQTTLSVNTTLYGGAQIPPLFHVGQNQILGSVITTCALSPSLTLGESAAPVGPSLMHPASYYFSCGDPTANAGNFEDMGTFPRFARVAISYDTMPPATGMLWGPMALRATWDDLAPTGKLRNQRGHEAAIAYRERGSEPFHYEVLSYDERGRVEAILRSNENLGFDAVYYTYNALNQVTSVTAADPMRQHTTWYGYDHNGRIDTVWTTLGSIGTGLVAPKPPANPKWLMTMGTVRKPTPLTRPATPDIVYSYTPTDQVAAMAYPQINTVTQYTYNHRKALDVLVATKGGSEIFKEALRYDPAGQIIEQRYPEDRQTYAYDKADRLTAWTKNDSADVTKHTYDAVGNRLSKTESWYGYNETDSVADGMSQLQKTTRHNDKYGDTLTTYVYDRNGNTTLAKVMLDSSKGSWPGWAAAHPGWPVPTFKGLLSQQEIGYSFRGLTNHIWTTDAQNKLFEWRYRYSPSGEREQKRLYYAGPSDSVLPRGWVYYLLGAHNQQLAVYHGQMTSGTMCSDTGLRVYMYPKEYLSYGIGGNASIVTDPTGAKDYRISDHIGSIRAVVAGGTVQRYDYEPFGKLLTAPVGPGPRKAYIDHENDPETDLNNLGLRQMASDKGRFLSGDISWERAYDASPYAYGLNNPVGLIDDNGAFPYTFWIRSFHPDETFGWGFAGDNRGFTTSTGKGVTSRIKQHFTLETDYPKSRFMLQDRTVESDPSSHWMLPGANAVSGSYGGYSQVNRTGSDPATFDFSASYAGANPLVPLSPDIDVQSQFSVTEDRKNGTLTINANIAGDGFPSAEAFVKDAKGQAVFLGVYQHQGSVFTQLWGLNHRPMMKVVLTLLVDQDGNFVGVKQNGKVMSISDWNAQMQK